MSSMFFDFMCSFFVLLFICEVDGLPTGAPCSTIETLIPAHGNETMTLPVPPVVIQFFDEYSREATCYWNGRNLTVSISTEQLNHWNETGNSSDEFEGFALQARQGESIGIRRTELTKCKSNPCVFGTCHNGLGNYRCVCQPGFTGINCDKNINECDSSPCVNGVCSDLRNYYLCFCERGYMGTNCDRNVDDCVPNPCKNRGECTDRLNAYKCTCRIGYTGYNCEIVPRDCTDIKERHPNATSGMYEIQPIEGRPVSAYCDMETLGGGWTVFQRRMNGKENFRRNWTDYKLGFGNVTREHWLGNDVIHAILLGRPQKLLVELGETNRSCFLRELYSSFSIGNENQDYVLYVASGDGSAGDSLTIHNGMKFSTIDRDNDNSENKHCAKEHQGGWWYKNCQDVNLNGLYSNTTCIEEEPFAYLNWAHAHGLLYSFPWTEMKMRGQNFELNKPSKHNWCREVSCDIRCQLDPKCPLK